ncbi:MAG: TMEM165/GDT1 family protein [Candidatus Baldrarchaeia archaeon]
MNLFPLFASFLLVFIAELGDKTQITVITLCSKWSRTTVFIGAMLAFLIVDGLSVLIGEALATILPFFWIQIVSGTIFILSGIFTILPKKNQEGRAYSYQLTILSTFTLVSLMELGDKTQIMVIALAAQYNAPIPVFIGVMLAFTIITGIGIAIGEAILKKTPEEYVKTVTAIIFIIFGTLLLVNSILKF